MTTLATKGRHFQVSWMVTCQKFNQVGRVIRSNARNLLVWRQRNAKEVESLCEELSGWYDKDTVMQMYEHATSEPYSWLTIRLDAKRREDAFWLRFEKRLLPSVKDDAGERLPIGESLGERADEPVAAPESGSKPPRGPGPSGRGLREGASVGNGDLRGQDIRPRSAALPSRPPTLPAGGPRR